MVDLGTCSFNYNEKLMVNGPLAWIPASPKTEYQTTEPTNFPFVDSFLIPDKKYTPQKINMEPITHLQRKIIFQTSIIYTWNHPRTQMGGFLVLIGV